VSTSPPGLGITAGNITAGLGITGRNGVHGRRRFAVRSRWQTLVVPPLFTGG